MENKELTITKIFNAPIEKVWKYWTDEEMLKKWWGPKNFTAPVVKIDFREGGHYLTDMRGSPAPDQPEKDFWSTGIYKKIEPLKKIVYIDSFADETGNIVPSSYYGMEGFPLEQEITLTFEKLDDNKTKLNLNYPSVGSIDSVTFDNMRQGWNQSFDKFEENLKI